MKRRAWAAGALAAIALVACSYPPRAPSEARSKLGTLEDILRSRNDNDPRLDREFNNLSPDDKRLFRLKYQQLLPELRNERGTVVYLLGKNLTSAEDWAFLRAVAAEPPCLSLAHCAKKAEIAEASDEVTLAYPALVALKLAEKALETGADAKEAWGVLEAAEGSQAPAAARMAGRLELQFAPKARP